MLDADLFYSLLRGSMRLSVDRVTEEDVWTDSLGAG
jgi:hypothetical protein